VLRSQAGEGNSAKVSVVAKIKGQTQTQLVRLGAQFRVQNEMATVAALNKAGFMAIGSGLMQEILVN
jgi:hypothetical protein